MNTHPEFPKSSFSELFDELLSMGDLSDQQKKEVYTQLEGTIVLRTVNKLMDKLSDDEKQELESSEILTEEDLLAFLVKQNQKEDMQKIMSQSAEEVVSEFLAKI